MKLALSLPFCVIVKHGVISINYVHHKSIYNVASETPNYMRTTCEERGVVFLLTANSSAGIRSLVK